MIVNLSAFLDGIDCTILRSPSESAQFIFWVPPFVLNGRGVAICPHPSDSLIIPQPFLYKINEDVNNDDGDLLCSVGSVRMRNLYRWV